MTQLILPNLYHYLHVLLLLSISNTHDLFSSFLYIQKDKELIILYLEHSNEKVNRITVHITSTEMSKK